MPLLSYIIGHKAIAKPRTGAEVKGEVRKNRTGLTGIPIGSHFVNDIPDHYHHSALHRKKVPGMGYTDSTAVLSTEHVAFACNFAGGL